MTTTARIHFVQATEPVTADLEERIVRAKHSAPDASLWVEQDGSPRIYRGRGILDRLERFFGATTIRPQFDHARKLCGQFVGYYWSVDRMSTDLDIYPTAPTVAAPVYWEYLVICHAPELPRILLRRPGVFQEESELARSEYEIPCKCGAVARISHCQECGAER